MNNKRKWRVIPRPMKFLVPVLLVLTGVLGYFLLINQLTSDSNSSPPPNISRISGLQLRNSIQEVQNVPSGLFKYSGAPTFAAFSSRPIREAISWAYPDFYLRYTEPLNGNPGSGTGIQMLINGELSFSQSARPIEDAEYSKAKAKGFALEQVAVAIDGVVFYTNRSLDIPGLSLEQLQAIFRGEVKNWRQLGGPDLIIKPVALNPKTTSALKLLLGTEGDDLGSNVQIVRDFTTAIRKVAATPGGISYASAPMIINQKTIRPLAIAKANSKQYVQPIIDNQQINEKAFRDGTYPMTRHVFIVFRRNGSIHEKAALAYSSMLLSKEGQEIVGQLGYVPIR